MASYDPSHMKFEVVLPIAEARRVLADMELLNCRKKAEHVRRCLLSGSAERDEELSFQLGSISLALNEMVRLIRDAGGTGMPELQRLSSLLFALVKDVSGQLNTRVRI